MGMFDKIAGQGFVQQGYVGMSDGSCVRSAERERASREFHPLQTPEMIAAREREIRKAKAEREEAARRAEYIKLHADEELRYQTAVAEGRVKHGKDAVTGERVTLIKSFVFKDRWELLESIFKTFGRSHD